jgi:arginine metabolism regulation protein II
MLDAYSYLRDVERLVSLHGQARFCRSKSVRMLHSTYLYLSTLQASIRAFSSNSISDVALNSAYNTGIWGRLLETDSPQVPGSVSDEDDDSSSDSQISSASVFEQVYSVPEELFRLIGRVTSLSLRIEQYGMNGTANMMAHEMVNEIYDLEKEICNWKNDSRASQRASISEIQPDSLDFPQEGPEEVRYHFRAALHSAVLVFFYKSVRKLDTYAVQPFVERTVHSLNLYTEAKRASGDKSSSICWPGFIAGCEALSPDLRQQMAQWFEAETAQTGIKMFEMAGRAARDVWNARNLSGDRNLPWAEILKRDNTLDKLVLS